MKKERILEMQLWKKKKTKSLVTTALFLGITLVIQLIRLPPPLTGPLINAILILTTILLGVKQGIAIGLLTPIGALLLGIIPPVLAPAVPFIMVGNSLYCLLFALLYYRCNELLGLLFGSLLKFAVIAGAAVLILDLPKGPSAALGLPQFITALTGGAGALLLKKYLLPGVKESLQKP